MPEPSLQEVQRWMVSRVLPPERSVPPGVEVELNLQGGEPGAERLAVYSGGYRARIEEALEEAYPAVRRVTGRRGFHQLAHAYAGRYPSQSYNLSRAGSHLPEFLDSHPLTGELPFLPDLARLEWMVVEAFHAFDQPTLDPASLSAIPVQELERIHLVFQPSVRVVRSAWPILDVWEARNRPALEIRIEMVNRPQRVLVTRQNLEVQCELLDELQYKLLSALREGKPLGESCVLLAEEVSGEAPLTEWFSGWAGRGLLAGAYVSKILSR